MKRGSEFRSCSALGCIAGSASREQRNLTGARIGLQGYEAGRLTVDRDGNLVFFPDATPDIGYIVGPNGVVCRAVRDPSTGEWRREPNGTLCLTDVIVDEGDPNARVVANRVDQGRGNITSV